MLLFHLYLLFLFHQIIILSWTGPSVPSPALCLVLCWAYVRCAVHNSQIKMQCKHYILRKAVLELLTTVCCLQQAPWVTKTSAALLLPHCDLSRCLLRLQQDSQLSLWAPGTLSLRRWGLRILPACLGYNSREEGRASALVASFHPRPTHSDFQMVSSRADFPQSASCCLTTICVAAVAPLLAIVPWGRGRGRDWWHMMTDWWHMIETDASPGPQSISRPLGRRIWNSSGWNTAVVPEICLWLWWDGMGVVRGQHGRESTATCALLEPLGQNCSWQPFFSAWLRQTAWGPESTVGICLNLQLQRPEEGTTLQGLCAGQEH